MGEKGKFVIVCGFEERVGTVYGLLGLLL